MSTNDDDMKPIPASFWKHFDPADALAVKEEGFLVTRRLYHDRQTYEDWGKGEFYVWFNDGRREGVTGVAVKAEDLKRAFPENDQ